LRVKIPWIESSALATYEMFFRSRVPPIVAINEASKSPSGNGTEDSGGL